MDRNSNKKEAAENPNRARTFYYVNIILLCCGIRRRAFCFA